ncbi:MAG: hypothetical protein WBV36_06785 [Terriglobales bacterium]
MTTWYKVTFPYGQSAAMANSLQLAFEKIWMSEGAPRNAALFASHGSSHEDEFIYFSPAAVAIAKSVVDEFNGVSCSPPAHDGTILLIGHADAREFLLPVSQR